MKLKKHNIVYTIKYDKQIPNNIPWDDMPEFRMVDEKFPIFNFILEKDQIIILSSIIKQTIKESTKCLSFWLE